MHRPQFLRLGYSQRGMQKLDASMPLPFMPAQTVAVHWSVGVTVQTQCGLEAGLSWESVLSPLLCILLLFL